MNRVSAWLGLGLLMVSANVLAEKAPPKAKPAIQPESSHSQYTGSRRWNTT